MSEDRVPSRPVSVAELIGEIDRHSANSDEIHQPFPLDPATVFKVEADRPLTWWDVSALNINRMIGTGIFTLPPTILMYTGRKDTALCIWAAGFVYTLISMTLYLEFARKLPYTGGDLIYLDELLPWPALLAYTCRAWYFVCIYTTATSSMLFGKQVIIAVTGAEVTDQRVMRLIAVAILSVICLLQFFSSAMGRRLNRWLAYLKIVVLLIILFAGAHRARKHPANDITKSFSAEHTGSATAILQVLFAFQGWENAALVAGEIPTYKTLRTGTFRAVCVVGLLYVFINVVYCFAISWNVDGTMNLGYIPMLFGNSPEAKMAWAALTASSAVGGMISFTYTCVRVNQTIAWTNILPWSTFWRSTAPIRKDESAQAIEMQILLQPLNEESGRAQPILSTAGPQGGIILHWVASTFWICVTTAIATVTEAVILPGQMVAYCSAVVGIVLGFWFPKLHHIENKVPEEREWLTGRERWLLNSRFLQYLFGWVYGAGSVALIVLAALGPYNNTDGHKREVKGWYFPVITFALIAASAVYYFVFFASESSTWLHRARVTLQRRKHGFIDDTENVEGKIVLRLCDQCAYQPGQEHRHARDGYLHYNEIRFQEGDQKRSLFYWLFGGTKESHQPNIHPSDIIVAVKRNISRTVGKTVPGSNK